MGREARCKAPSLLPLACQGGVGLDLRSVACDQQDLQGGPRRPLIQVVGNILFLSLQGGSKQDFGGKDASLAFLFRVGVGVREMVALACKMHVQVSRRQGPGLMRSKYANLEDTGQERDTEPCYFCQPWDTPSGVSR
jgi:hypothetical protein